MLFTLPLLSLAMPAVAQSPVVLQPSAVINAEGDLQENVSVLIQGDRILAVGEDLEVPAQAFVLPLDGVLAPGFVDGFSHLGAFALEEGARTSTPQFRAAESLNLDSDWWQARMEQGVTSVQLVPNPLGSDEPIHPLSGWSCVVATWGDTLGDRFVDDASRQTLGALGGPWRSRQGGPGALAGVADALSAEVPLVKGAQQTGFVAYVDSAEGIQAARDAVANGELHFLCRGDVARYAGLLGDSIAGLEALTENDFQLRRLETIKRMHERGVTVAFGSDTGDSWSTPMDLRQSAMVYSRVTGDSAAAMRSITSAAADLAGVGDDLGRIQAGTRADLVLWTGHPLDAQSRVVSVLIAGQTACSGPVEESR